MVIGQNCKQICENVQWSAFWFVFPQFSVDNLKSSFSAIDPADYTPFIVLYLYLQQFVWFLTSWCHIYRGFSSAPVRPPSAPKHDEMINLKMMWNTKWELLTDEKVEFSTFIGLQTTNSSLDEVELLVWGSEEIICGDRKGQTLPLSLLNLVLTLYYDLVWRPQVRADGRCRQEVRGSWTWWVVWYKTFIHAWSLLVSQPAWEQGHKLWIIFVPFKEILLQYLLWLWFPQTSFFFL